MAQSMEAELVEALREVLAYGRGEFAWDLEMEAEAMLAKADAAIAKATEVQPPPGRVCEDCDRPLGIMDKRQCAGCREEDRLRADEAWFFDMDGKP